MYARAFAWLAAISAIMMGTSLIGSTVFVDFVQHNPHRTRETALAGLVIAVPILGLMAAIEAIIALAASQAFQAWVSVLLVRRFGGRALPAVLLFLPVTAVLTWYSWDYLTPPEYTLGINAGPGWRPYVHGLTLQRYLVTLGLQALASLFSVAYAGTISGRYSRRMLVRLALLAALVAGVACGYATARASFGSP